MVLLYYVYIHTTILTLEVRPSARDYCARASGRGLRQTLRQTIRLAVTLPSSFYFSMIKFLFYRNLTKNTLYAMHNSEVSLKKKISVIGTL